MQSNAACKAMLHAMLRALSYIWVSQYMGVHPMYVRYTPTYGYAPVVGAYPHIGALYTPIWGYCTVYLHMGVYPHMGVKSLYGGIPTIWGYTRTWGRVYVYLHVGIYTS